MNRPRPSRLALTTAVASVAVAYLAVGPAQAERSGRNGVVVSFNARVSPKVLPRNRLAPVTLSLTGSVLGAEGGTRPRLDRLELAFGARGGLDVAGLPTCPRSSLRNATRRQALARCRSALVGRGSIVAEVPLAPDRPLRARARALAFNARKGGRRAIWVHAYSASPPVSFVLPFTVHVLRRGSGLQLEAPVGSTLGRWPRLRSFQITLGRRYRSHGQRHSYLSGSCPLPPRLHSLSVPVAHATYNFSPAPAIGMTIFRACRVRD